VTVEEGSASSKAVERDGKAYCRECFRREFPVECEVHPGSKLTAQCFVCNSMCCENCVIELADRLVCSRCKEWALERIRNNLPFMTPEVPPWKDWDRYEVSEELAKPRLSLARIAVTAVMAVIATLFFLPNAKKGESGFTAAAGYIALIHLVCYLYFTSWHLRRKHRLLRAVWVNMHSITTETFSGRISGARWREVSRVLISSDVETEKVDSIVVYGMDSSTVIRGPFTRFWEIASAVRHICEDRGIQCEEVRRPSFLRSLLRSFPRFSSKTDDVLYDQTKEASGCITAAFMIGVVAGIPILSAIISMILGDSIVLFVVIMVVIYAVVLMSWSRFIYAPGHRLWLSRSSVRVSIPRSRHKSAARWQDVTEVRIELWPEDKNDRRIVVNAREDYIEIPGNMPKFNEIEEFIRDICRERGIKYIEEKE
jgi:hypothetical protein